MFVLLLGQLSRKVFFGQLRPAETEVKRERITNMSIHNVHITMKMTLTEIYLLPFLSSCVAFDREILVCRDRDMPCLHSVSR